MHTALTWSSVSTHTSINYQLSCLQRSPEATSIHEPEQLRPFVSSIYRINSRKHLLAFFYTVSVKITLTHHKRLISSWVEDRRRQSLMVCLQRCESAERNRHPTETTMHNKVSVPIHQISTWPSLSAEDQIPVSFPTRMIPPTWHRDKVIVLRGWTVLKQEGQEATKT